MYCSHCGKRNQEAAIYCGYCGKAITTNTSFKKTSSLNSQSHNDYSNPTNTISMVPKKKTNIKFYIAGLFIAIIIVSSSVYSFLNSKEYLEKRLIKNTWYEDVWDEMLIDLKPGESDVLTFYADGFGSGEIYERYKGTNMFGSEVISSPRYSRDFSFSWEILEDKTLYYLGAYYKYKDEWYFDGNSILNIGGTEYKSWNQCGYEKYGELR